MEIGTTVSGPEWAPMVEGRLRRIINGTDPAASASADRWIGLTNMDQRSRI